MVGEKATTDITISKDSLGFEECKDSAVEGGTIAKNTRKELEEKIGLSSLNWKETKKGEGIFIKMTKMAK
jgi:hypothetical protein